jgi:AcrR family transcriptional regulator
MKQPDQDRRLPRGRPRSFDKVEALEKAMHIFWRDGYGDASLADLCSATGLTKPSLYAAYGNKEALFLSALDRYMDDCIRPAIEPLLSADTARDGIRTLLRDTVNALCDGETPLGCMIANSVGYTSLTETPPPVSAAILAASKETPNAIRARLIAANVSGDIDAKVTYFETLIAGLSTLARQGMSRDTLLKVVDTAFIGWPEV